MQAIFKEMYGQDAQIRALHAGLECGLFAEALPDMDIVSIGPDMQAIHSPDEKIHIASVQRTWEFLLKVLAAPEEER